MKNLDERAKVYGRQHGDELMNRLDELGMDTGMRDMAGVNATHDAAAAWCERAFRDGAMVAEQEAKQPTRLSIRLNDADELGKLILADSRDEENDFARGFNMGLRRAVFLMQSRGTVKVPA